MSRGAPIDNRSTVEALPESLASLRLPGMAEEGLALVVGWSREEPDRVGEVAFIEGERLLGRGGARPEDGVRRVELCRQRPGSTTLTGPIGSMRISRQQLRLRVEGDRLHVASLGLCPLLVNGRRAERAEVGPGDTLHLENELLFVVARRPFELLPMRAPVAEGHVFGRADALGLVGESPAMWALRDLVAFTARSRGHVLVRGESGAGKELVARAVHALSPRSARPLISRNAATFPEGLVDAELFGNAKNYPNPGMSEREGIIGEADQSTLFLDEIGELPARLQAHLLRVLDRHGEYQRLGESRVRTSDVRVVAATNRGVEELKHDLAARLTLRIEVPGLADRREDIPLLARHLLEAAASANQHVADAFATGRDGERIPVRVDPKLIDALVRHAYRTHTRELEQILWRALVEGRGRSVEVTSGVQSLLDVPEASAPPPAEATREAIEAALARHGGNVTRAARDLGMTSRFVLYRIMKKMGIGGEEPDAEG